MDLITAFFGRFHPLMVHLPIGILLLAFIFECLTAKEKYKNLKSAVQPSLLWGTVFAILSAITGFFLRQEGGYDERIANFHQNAGICTAVLSLIVYVLRRRLKFWILDPDKRKRLRILLFTPLIILLLFTGHLGGSLTHGEDYLFAPVETEDKPDATLKIDSIKNIAEARMYEDVVQPILEARCYECHSSRKQKGNLRLDQETFIMRGGKHGEVISDGIIDSSALYHRLTLPLEEKHHMPPNDEQQLSSSHIDLIKYWIEDKPLFQRKISELHNSDKIVAIIQSLQERPQQSWVPVAEAEQATENAFKKIVASGLHPMPVAENSHYLLINFSGLPRVTDEQLKNLLLIKDQLVWLNLGHSTVTNGQLEIIAKLTSLRVLHLNNTQIGDEGIQKLVHLKELVVLNLVGTAVTSRSVPVLLKFEKMTNLFLYQTKLSKQDVELLIEREQLAVDTGNYQLQKLVSDTIEYKMTTTKK